MHADRRLPNTRSNCQSGQALTEYILIISGLMILVTGAVIPEFLSHVGAFYSNILKIVCLPLP